MPSNVKEKTQPRIVWSEESINVTVPQGEKATKTLTLKSSEKIDDVMLEPVPELAQFLRVQPATLSSIKADIAQEVSISFSIPADAAPRTLEGTIHVRQGKITLPQTLKVVLKIEQSPEERGTEMISPAKVSLAGASEVTFNACAVTPVRFDITRASLRTAPETFKVLFNGAEVPATNIQVTPASVALSVALNEGRNKLILLATDESWRLVYKAVTLWAGSRTLDVGVFDENNQPAVDAVVNINLGDDKRVAVAASAVNGSAHFVNLPDRTIFLRATATGNRFASLATHGGIGSVQLKLRSFDEPSLIDNNDFSQGTAGWNIGTARVRLVPHDEGTFNPSAAALSAKQTAAPAIAASPAALQEERLARHLELSKEAQRTSALASTPSASQADEGDKNLDLDVITYGEGQQSIWRTFKPKKGTQSVKVRYRFVTSEYPNGFYNSQYNDCFEVTVRSEKTGNTVFRAESMNGLPPTAFTEEGATRWYETTLKLNTEGDTVQVEVCVTNVGDGLFDSYVTIDLIVEQKVELGEFKGVARGGVSSLMVTMAEGQAPVTLDISVLDGEGEARFAANDSTSITIDKTTLVEIKGIKTSSRAGNIRVEAKQNGESVGYRDFSVIWMTLAIRTRDGVSEDNGARDVYINVLGTDQLGTFYSAGHGASPGLTTAIEIVGTVEPEDFRGRVLIKRIVKESRVYWGTVENESQRKIDMEDWMAIDNALNDFDLEPNGKAYDIDAPAPVPGVDYDPTVLEPIRRRTNFVQWAEFENQRVSDDILWFSAISIKKNEEGRFVRHDDVPGDNVANNGQLFITWDLNPPPLPGKPAPN